MVEETKSHLVVVVINGETSSPIRGYYRLTSWGQKEAQRILIQSPVIKDFDIFTILSESPSPKKILGLSHLKLLIKHLENEEAEKMKRHAAKVKSIGFSGVKFALGPKDSGYEMISCMNRFILYHWGNQLGHFFVADIVRRRWDFAVYDKRLLSVDEKRVIQERLRLLNTHQTV